MEILIVGGDGFIGSHVSKYFQSNSPNHTYTLNWSTDCIEEIKNLFDERRFDVVINATGSADVVRSIIFPTLDFEANVVFHFHLLDVIKDKDCKYIYFSSAAVYGNPEKLPVHESDPINPVSPYGWHKYYGEQMCKEFASLYKMKTASLRLFSVFGPGQKKMLFYDLFEKCRLDGNSIELKGFAIDSRDFIFVEDVMRAVETIINNAPMNGESYNVSSGKERTVKEVAGTFVSLVSPGKNICFTGDSFPGYPSNWKADISAISNLGFKVETDFEEGIAQTVAWLKEHVTS